MVHQERLFADLGYSAIYLKNRKLRDEQFLGDIKEALKIIAAANSERNKHFPLDLKKKRLAAFHDFLLTYIFFKIRSVGISPVLNALLSLALVDDVHRSQYIILTTRPLLFRFWHKRLSGSRPFRVSFRGGIRNLYGSALLPHTEVSIF